MTALYPVSAAVQKRGRFDLDTSCSGTGGGKDWGVAMGKRDPREVLGVRPDASEDDLKEAYRRLAIRYHPDRSRGDKAAEAKFKEVNEAYGILKKAGHFQRDGGGIVVHVPLRATEAELDVPWPATEAGLDVPLETLVPGGAGALAPTLGDGRSRLRGKHLSALLILLIGGALLYAHMPPSGPRLAAHAPGPITASVLPAPVPPEVAEEVPVGKAAAPAPAPVAGAPAGPSAGSGLPSVVAEAGPSAVPSFPAPPPAAGAQRVSGGEAADRPGAAQTPPARDAGPARPVANVPVGRPATPEPDGKAPAQAGDKGSRVSPSSASPALVEALIARGDAMMSRCDISAARLLYERAAAGDARAASALARTYDPAFLAEIGTCGIRGDAALAAAWYRKAASLGDGGAPAKAEALSGPDSAVQGRP